MLDRRIGFEVVGFGLVGRWLCWETLSVTASSERQSMLTKGRYLQAVFVVAPMPRYLLGTNPVTLRCVHLES